MTSLESVRALPHTGSNTNDEFKICISKNGKSGCGKTKVVSEFRKGSRICKSCNSLKNQKLCVQNKKKNATLADSVRYEGTKKCRGCRKTKPRIEFHKAESRKDGLRSDCKECENTSGHSSRDGYKKANATIGDERHAGMKHCPTCKINRPKTDFKAYDGRKDGLETNCKSCEVVRKQISELKNSHLKYGIGYMCPRPDTLVACQMCGDVYTANEICLDHDKRSLLPRGYLCNSCNSLMHTGISPDRLTQYAFYCQSTTTLSSLIPKVKDIELSTRIARKRKEAIEQSRHSTEFNEEMLTSICVECGKEKYVNSFYIKKSRSGKSDTQNSRCKICWSLQGMRYHKMKPNINNAITLQGGCGICACKTSVDGWHIDHKHGTDIIRAILCRRCNLDLGFGRENTSIFLSGIPYLANPPHQIQLIADGYDLFQLSERNKEYAAQKRIRPRRKRRLDPLLSSA